MRINGTSGNNSLTGTSSTDQILGLDGDDTLLGLGGRDTLDGGNGADVLDGGAGDDTLRGGAGNDRLLGGAGDDAVEGGSGDDEMLGGSGGDSMFGGAGNDQIFGENGDDLLNGGTGNDKMDGGAGADELQGETGDDDMQGGAGNDELWGNVGNDKLFGGDGDDLLDGGEGNDLLEGGAGADEMGGGEHSDILRGQDGNDRMWGDAGNDTVDGGAGNDYVDGGSGDDNVLGGDGDDRLVGGRGDDAIAGGAGTDTLELTGRRSQYNVTFDATVGVWLVRDTTSSRDGTDRVAADVEQIRFSDQTLVLTPPAANRAPVAGVDQVVSAAAGTATFALAPPTPTDPDGNTLTVTIDSLPSFGQVRTAAGALVTAGAVLSLTDFAGLRFTPPATGVFAAQTLAYTVRDPGGLSDSATISIAVTDPATAQTYTGGAGDDAFRGGTANDTFNPGAGANTTSAGGGDDTVNTLLDGAPDTVDGGTGTDTLSVTGAAGPNVVTVAGGSVLTVDLAGTPGVDVTATGVEELVLRFGDAIDRVTVVGDLIAAGLAPHTLEAFLGGGNDTFDASGETGPGERVIVHGEGGDDTITGGIADDVLEGGAGNDTLNGGGGFDVVLFSGVSTDYSIVQNGNITTVTHLNGGADGVDTIIGPAVVNFLGDNQKPVIFQDLLPNQTGSEGTPFSFTVPALAFRDPEGDTLTWSAALSNGNALPGWLSFDPSSRVLSGTPGQTDGGTSVVRISVNDGHGGISFWDINVAIAAVNVNPVANPDSITTNEDTSVIINVLGNDTDIDNNTLSVTQIAGQTATAGTAISLGAGNGSATLNADGTITYAPTANANGSRSFSYTISDGSGGSSTATATVDITPVLDTPIVNIQSTHIAPFGNADTHVTSPTTGNNRIGAVAGFLDGSFVITWATVAGSPVPSFDIVAQRFNAAGSPVGAVIPVNTITAGHQYYTSIAALLDGGFIIAYASSGPDGSGLGVFTRRYDATGNATTGEVRVNTAIALDQFQPAVVALPSGGYVIAWTSNIQDGSGYGIYEQMFDATGARVGVETRVNTTTIGGQITPTVTVLTNGNYVVTWTSTYGYGTDGVFGQMFSAAGAPIGAEFRVSDPIEGQFGAATVAALTGGGFVVTWTLATEEFTSSEVYFRRYNASGVAQGSLSVANTFFEAQEEEASVIALPDGGFVITWAVRDEGQLDIFGQRFTATGAQSGAEFQINSTTLGNQGFENASHPVMALLPASASAAQAVLHVFTSNGEIYFHRLNPAAFGGKEDGVIFLPVQVIPRGATETITVVLSGLPAGSQLSTGNSTDGGMTWTINGPPPAGLRFLPPANFNGQFTLGISVTTQEGSQTSTVTTSRPVSIEARSEPPVAVNDTAFTTTNTPVVIDVLANDTDPENDPLVVVTIDNHTVAAGGTVRLAGGDKVTRNMDGTLTYTPPDGVTGDRSFTYIITDRNGNTPGLATATVTITPGNNAPSAGDDISFTTAGTPVLIDVQANDSDSNGDARTITHIDARPATIGSPVALTSGGTATLNPNGTITYTPPAGSITQRTFHYTVSDGHGGTDTAAVTVGGAAVIGFGDGAIIPIDTGDTRVNTTTTGVQSYSAVSALPDGGHVVVWASVTGAGAPPNEIRDVFMQRFAADGSPAGPQTIVNQTLPGQTIQSNPAVATLADGSYVVTWSQFSLTPNIAYEVLARRFLADGTPLTGELIASAPASQGSQVFSVIEAIGAGYVIAWQTFTAATNVWAINARMFDAANAPVGATFQVNQGGNVNSRFVDIARLADGDFAVVYQSYLTEDADIYVRHFNSAGVAVGDEMLVNTTTAGEQGQGSIAALADGGFVVTWSSYRQEGVDFGADAYMQVYDAGGHRVGGEIMVNPDAAGGDGFSTVTALADGSFVISWTSGSTLLNDGVPNGSEDIVMQHFAANGARIGDVIRVNATRPGIQFTETWTSDPPIAIASDGTLIQTFYGDGDVQVRRFDTNGFSGVEDTAMTLPVTVTAAPGQTLSQVVLSGLPAGSVLSGGGSSTAGGTVWTFNGALPANLTFTPPTDFNGTFTLNVTATTSAGSSSATHRVYVAPVDEASALSTTGPDGLAQTSLFDFGQPIEFAVPELPPMEAVHDIVSLFSSSNLASETGGFLDLDAGAHLTPGDGFSPYSALGGDQPLA